MPKKNYIRDGRAPIPERELTSKVMSSIKGKNTKPEISLRKALWKEGIKGYRIHWKKVPGKPDIAFPGKRIAVFINGCFWHRCPKCNPSTPKSHISFWDEKFKKNKERDIRKQEALLSLGWKVLIIWECEIKKDLDSCVLRVNEIIE